MFGFFRKKKKDEGLTGFWAWLSTHTERIQRDLLDDPQGISAEIGDAFKADYPTLSWEVSPTQDGSPWMFCISADGDIERFPMVTEAVEAAPTLPEWKVQAFKPRGPMTVELEFGPYKLSPDDIWCRAEPMESGIGLVLLIRGLTEENVGPLSQGAVILLDNAVGEYDSVMKIKALDRAPLPENPEQHGGLFPFVELPALLDKLPG